MNARDDTATSPSYADCSGCSLCLLVCPVWQRSRDLALTPHGRAKALQNGVTADDMVESIESCNLCGACRPVCPEGIDPVDMVIALRRQLPPPIGWLVPSLAGGLASAPGAGKRTYRRIETTGQRHDLLRWIFAKGNDEDQGRRSGEFDRPICELSAPGGRANSPDLLSSHRAFLPGPELRKQTERLSKVCALLGADLQVADDDGADITLALEAGALLPQQRLERFLAPLQGTKSVIVADGLLCHYLPRWLPKVRIISLGEALSSQARIRSQLRASDLYVIEARAYHADYQRLVNYYDRLRQECGCDLNLDLQRIAIPAAARSLPQRLGGIAPDNAAQIGWLLQGRKMRRIVVENFEDYVALAQASHCEVVYLVDLAGGAQHAQG